MSRTYPVIITVVWALVLIGVERTGATELPLPAGSRLTVERNTAPDRFTAPIGVYTEGMPPSLELEGVVNRSAWRADAQGMTPLQVIRPIRDALEAAGYRLLFECDEQACGGFDFRFALEVLPGPHMYVNLRAYHYLTALRGTVEVPEQVVSILVSTSATSAYVQIVDIAIGRPEPVKIENQQSVATTAKPVRGAFPSEVAEAVLTQGRVVLEGLTFDTGTAVLGEGADAVLAAVARLLSDRPGLRVALVGHTDSVGSLNTNIALSRRRAQAVRQELIETYGVRADRLQAEGMGYLAPIASNLTSEGREHNRRVELILLSEE